MTGRLFLFVARVSLLLSAVGYYWTFWLMFVSVLNGSVSGERWWTYAILCVVTLLLGTILGLLGVGANTQSQKRMILAFQLEIFCQ
jgi:NADH:ubiquinone oxidoreductase subunit 6 (subunit J)